ncbi:hypothetical protein H340_05756 [Streptomyces mobaraensis NBRC 13819 = DSM 40847]|uniref:DUF6603 domain-containing protein n=1 Tax=Streptomyces mobaraensis (strain ATCC 29032 / DSM 40847 / JCM 4168 / NBRC 13819 / NCIMB 11159 / IPCR 16-22) TaxID=1223523 RepID=M3CBU8_STRM1|nr:DUF6603 domain-containing protein [Streptomyces mobaraensis]EMF01517.1 hypothetical protein H340_05756 [Streptomyces mobaraensis NBRC 13819 = DSM 40847]
MTTPLPQLAAQLRAGLDPVLPLLAGLPDDATRRQRLAQGLGLPGGALTPDALLVRLALPDAGSHGDVWSVLVELLRTAVGQAPPGWQLAIKDVLTVGPGPVPVPAVTALPPTINLSFDLTGALSLVPGLAVRDGISLVLSLPSATPDDCSLAFRADGIALTLTGDDLLGLLVPGGLAVKGRLGVRLDKNGLRLEGGAAGKGVAIPLNQVPSVLRAPALHVSVRDGGLRLDTSFRASLLGIGEATVDGAGLEVRPSGGGFTATPVMPTGFGLALAVGPAKGGGFLAAHDGRYEGALSLSLGIVEVRAFGILDTRPVSVLVVLSALFTPPIELGLAVTLNAVGGIVGVGRALDRAGLAQVVQAGHVDDLLFPADPVAAAPRVLAELGAVFPARPGSTVVGPMFRIGWGRPVSFLTADIGVVLELPGGVVGILGRLRVALPAPQAPVLDLRASVAGVVDAANGLVEIVADLAGSRLLTASIAGGLALRVKSGQDATFVLSAGGFHPRFTPPDGFPTPKRLTIAIADSPLLHIVFSGYFALTPGTVQAGAELSAVIGSRGTGVTGRLTFDALVRWEPSFGVQLDLSGSFELRFASKTLCSLGLRVHVDGPTPCWHVAGRAGVSFLFFDVSFPFDERWDCSGETDLPPLPDVRRLLEQALDDPRNWEPVLPDGVRTMASLGADDAAGGRLLHPLGRPRFSQRIVPLGIEVAKYGPGRLPRPTAFDVTVTFAGGAGTAQPVTADFARADFFDLTDDEKLTQPAFEQFRSGSELTPPAPAVTAPAYSVPVEYETKWLGGPVSTPKPPWRITDAAFLAALPFGAVGRSLVHELRERYVSPPITTPDKPVLKDRSYAIVPTGTLKEAGFARTNTFTEATAQLRTVSGRSALHQVVPAYEVRP